MSNVNLIEKFKINEIDGLYLKIYRQGRILGYKKDPTKINGIVIEKIKDKKTKQEKKVATKISYEIKERNISECFLQTFVKKEVINEWVNTKTSPLIDEQLINDKEYKKVMYSLNYKWNKLSKTEKLFYYLSLFDEGYGVDVSPYYEDEYFRKKKVK